MQVTRRLLSLVARSIISMVISGSWRLQGGRLKYKYPTLGWGQTEFKNLYLKSQI